MTRVTAQGLPGDTELLLVLQTSLKETNGVTLCTG